jgi:hypothetical protein
LGKSRRLHVVLLAKIQLAHCRRQRRIIPGDKPDRRALLLREVDLDLISLPRERRGKGLKPREHHRHRFFCAHCALDPINISLGYCNFIHNV